MAYIFLILGFILLVKGADWFVEGSAAVAKQLRIPTVVIGLTVVAFGTSMPEASVSITAALQGKNDLAVSNVIGSNIFNILAVLGCCALIAPVKANLSVLKKEFPFSILITGLLLFLVSDMAVSDILEGRGSYTLGRTGGILLLVLMTGFVMFTVRDALRSRSEAEEEPGLLLGITPLKSGILIVLGLAGIIWGGNCVVDGATTIAESFGLSQTFIGLTVVALGTSLPELVTSIVAASKGESDLAVGNVVGSNIFNILLILGISATISPITVDVSAVYDTIILLGASVFAYICALTKRGISRSEGVLFLIGYLGFFVYILSR